jgi:deferrochelatase/peroxidase EfeB
MSGGLSRRRLLAGSGLATAGLLAATAAGATAGSLEADATPSGATTSHQDGSSTVPFYGSHQAGIATPEQARMAFAAYDVTAGDTAALTSLLAQWTDAAARLTAGEETEGPAGPFVPPPDTGEAIGLAPSNLTITVGFGPTLFDGRFGLAHRRPDALVGVPAFAGDALEPARSGGDLCIQACADDAQVAFHAVHTLTRLALGSATLRYLQIGFARAASAGGRPSPRNLLGFHDGTNNLVPADEEAMRRFVWVNHPTDQPWMIGGTYLVARRIRIHLEAWNDSTLVDQEQTIGRHRDTGAPLGGGTSEDYPVDLNALDSNGEPLIPDHAHIRVAAPGTNHGQALLRRGYSFADGVDASSGELDAGLFFICFQRDPRDQFIPIQQRLSQTDALAEYLLPTGSAIFACPPGIEAGEHWGAGLI